MRVNSARPEDAAASFLNIHFGIDPRQQEDLLPCTIQTSHRNYGEYAKRFVRAVSLKKLV